MRSAYNSFLVLAVSKAVCTVGAVQIGSVAIAHFLLSSIAGTSVVATNADLLEKGDVARRASNRSQ